MSFLIFMGTLMIILTSGSVFFTYKINVISLFILFGLSSVIFLFRRKINNKNIYLFIILVILLLSNTLMNINNNIAFDSVLNYILKIFFIMIFCSNITFEEFKKFFVGIIGIISIISLITFGISEIYGFNVLPGLCIENLGTNMFIYTPYLTIGWESAFHRNAGIFWEPGAFQLYINLAMFFILDKKILSTKDNIYLVILIITLLSTKSTTGYLIFIMLIINYTVKRKVREKINKKTIIVSLICMLGIIFLMYNFDIVSDKLNNDNISFVIRKNDLFGSLKIISNNPLGLGFLSQKFFDLQSLYNINSNSNGLLYLTGMLGIIYILVLVIASCKIASTKVFELSKFTFIIMILVIHTTEVIVLMPITYMFIYRNDNVE